MALDLYAGTSASSLHKLPSPIAVKPSHEQIWSNNTGRAQEGDNIAKMIGSSIAEKITYNVQWGVLTQTQFNTIKTYLKKGFFYFAVATSASDAESNASSFYRGNISYTLLPIGSTIYYKDVTVDVIEQ